MEQGVKIGSRDEKPAQPGMLCGLIQATGLNYRQAHLAVTALCMYFGVSEERLTAAIPYRKPIAPREKTDTLEALRCVREYEFRDIADAAAAEIVALRQRVAALETANYFARHRKHKGNDKLPAFPPLTDAERAAARRASK